MRELTTCMSFVSSVQTLYKISIPKNSRPVEHMKGWNQESGNEGNENEY